MQNILAIIGGSGLYEINSFKSSRWINVRSLFGKPSDSILEIKNNNKKIYFLPRHGRNHHISPSNINYRANIDILKKLGVTDLISISAVGSLRKSLSPGKFVLVDQFIDRTFLRKKTFFDEDIVAHVSLSKPVSKGLVKACEASLKKKKISFVSGGTYLAMEGPQFSSKAESNLYRSWKADVIGMTNMPEAKLAREAEIRYASVAMVTDYDCWHPNHEDVDVEMIVKVMHKNALKAQRFVVDIIQNFENFTDPNDPATKCLDTAIITNKKYWSKKSKKKLKNIIGRLLN